MNMPMNEKGEWTNPEDSQKEADDYKGYSECRCGKGVHLRQAGFEVDLHRCATCKSEVADAEEFFTFQYAVRVMSK